MNQNTQATQSTQSSYKLISIKLIDSPHLFNTEQQERKIPAGKILARAKSFEFLQTKFSSDKQSRREIEEEIIMAKKRLKLLKIQDEKTEKDIQETHKKKGFIKDLKEKYKEKKRNNEKILIKQDLYIQKQKLAILRRKQEDQMKQQRQQDAIIGDSSTIQEIKFISKQIKQSIEQSRVNILNQNSRVGEIQQHQKDLFNNQKNKLIQGKVKSKRNYLQRAE